MNTPSPTQSFLGAAFGTLLEYYDYALFGIFMPLLSPLFFPAHSLYESLVKSYFVLLISMLARPFGGLCFGYLGDVLGRRKALLTSLYGIALATTLIGLTPTYANIGIAATVLLFLSKTIQVFCFGGEFNGAGIYAIEHAQQKKEIFTSCLLSAMTLFGSLIASCFGVLATYPFMPQWSWRLAFLLGGLIGFFGLFYRKNMAESPHFDQANLKYQGLKAMLKEYPQELLAGMFIGGFATVPFTTVVIFINPVLLSEGYFTHHALMLTQTFLIFCAVLVLLIVGLSANRSTPFKLMRASAAAFAFFSYPLLLAVDSRNLFFLIPALTFFVIFNEIFLGPIHVYFKNIFKMQYRYRASSFSFCIGMSLFGGLTPLIENYLYKINGKFSSLSLWLIFIGLGTVWSLARVHKKQAALEFSFSTL